MDVRFAYPTTLAAALSATAAGHRPVAGGTDLVVGTRQGKWTLPENLVALDRIAELRGVERTSGGLRIGATTSHADLAGDPLIRERWTAIADAASIVGSPATRHVGTLGGNLANASPAAETSGPLLCFEADVEVRSTAGSRRIALADLFSGPGRTTVRPDELIVAVELPELDGAGIATSDWSSVGRWRSRWSGRRPWCASLTGSSVTPRIAITALAPTVRRVAVAEFDSPRIGWRP